MHLRATWVEWYPTIILHRPFENEATPDTRQGGDKISHPGVFYIIYIFKFMQLTQI